MSDGENHGPFGQKNFIILDGHWRGQRQTIMGEENHGPFGTKNFRGGAGGRRSPDAHPGCGGGPWLRRVLLPSGLRAVVVPSGLRVSVQPQR